MTSQIFDKKIKIMGILNLTPDSFSDGGLYNSVKKALQQAQKLEREGADILDIGGESSGPNSKNIALEEELRRVIPALKKIRQKIKIHISVDTCKAEVARQALAEGANIINDVTALRGDSKMAKTAARYNCPIILMYAKDKTARTTLQNKRYTDIMQTIKTFFQKRLSHAKKHGIKDKNIILDPGMGHFISAIPAYSYEIIARLNELKSLQKPILLGISRKSFLGGNIAERDTLGLGPTAIAILNGASIIRTHDVKAVKKLCQQCSLA